MPPTITQRAVCRNETTTHRQNDAESIPCPRCYRESPATSRPVPWRRSKPARCSLVRGIGTATCRHKTGLDTNQTIDRHQAINRNALTLSRSISAVCLWNLPATACNAGRCLQDVLSLRRNRAGSLAASRPEKRSRFAVIFKPVPIRSERKPPN